MSHIDTLQVYKEYLDAGFDEQKARAMTLALDNSFMTKIKEFKDDFVSNKLVSILGIFIIIVMTGIFVQLRYVSKEVAILSKDMQELKQSIKEIRNYIFT